MDDNIKTKVAFYKNCVLNRELVFFSYTRIHLCVSLQAPALARLPTFFKRFQIEQ